MNKNIHPTAIIEDGAVIEEGVQIGPYCVIGKDVKIGKNTILKSHITIDGIVEIGENNKFFPFVSIDVPQDLKFHGEKSKVIIGNDNTIREYVTIQHGTESGRMSTEIGNNCLLMVGVHVAHDCIVGNGCILANNATLAGHVTVEDFVVIGGLAAVHQFTRIGRHAMIGGMAGVENDVIPFASVISERGWLGGLNIIGMKRNDFSREEIHNLRNFYKEMFIDSNDHSKSEKLAKLKEKYSDSKSVKYVLDFLDIESKRGLCTPKKSN